MLQLVDDTMRSAIATGDIGAPCAARLTDCSVDSKAELLPRLAHALAAACRWLETTPMRLFVAGAVERGQLTAQFVSADGKSGIASVAACGSARRDQIDATVVGNRGIVSWDGDCADDLLTAEKPARNADPQAKRLLPAIELALEAACAVELDEHGKPAAVEALPVMDVATDLTRGLAAGRPAIPPPYGVLLVTGAHSHQENYAAAFAADPRCRLLGVVDESGVSQRRRELNERLAQRLGIPHLSDLDAALARDDVDIVSICAAPERRARIILRAARAGKHLYLDKPLAASAAEAREIDDAVGETGVAAHMFTLVWSKAAQRARSLAASGALGETTAIHADAFFAKGPSGTATLGRPRSELAAPREFERLDAKRELHNVGVYPLALLGRLLAEPVRRVFATTANYFFAEHQQADMEDFALATLEFASGRVTTVATGRTGWQSHAAGGLNRTRIIGRGGAVLIDAHRPRLETWSASPPWQPPQRHAEDPMGFWSSTTAEAGLAAKNDWIAPAETESDAGRFLDALEHGHPFDAPIGLAADVLTTIMAAYRSAAAGQVVELRR